VYILIGYWCGAAGGKRRRLTHCCVVDVSSNMYLRPEHGGPCEQLYLWLLCYSSASCIGLFPAQSIVVWNVFILPTRDYDTTEVVRNSFLNCCFLNPSKIWLNTIVLLHV